MNSSSYRFQQIIHCILACRVLLLIRDFGKRTISGDEFRTDVRTDLSTVGALQFADISGRLSENDIESSV